MKINKSLTWGLRNFCKERGITYCAIFGSRARGDGDKRSDLDLLVDVPDEISLFGFVRLARELEQKIGIKIDMIEREALKNSRRPFTQYFREEIKEDLKVLYEEGG